MSRYKSLLVVAAVFILFCAGTLYAEEKITISTFYPAPYGNYDELASNSMAVGSGYAAPASNGYLTVEQRIGVGTTAPASGLHVLNSDIRVQNGSFIDDGTTLTVPDYVFSPGYDLKPLSKVEEFILENKHLESLPSTDDIKGWAALSMQDRDMKLLQKIEELTLYIIQLEKRITELENDAK